MAPMAMNFAVLQHSQPDVLNGHSLLDMDPADQALPLSADSGRILFGKISYIDHLDYFGLLQTPQPIHYLIDDLLQLNTGSLTNDNEPHVYGSSWLYAGALLNQGTVE